MVMTGDVLDLTKLKQAVNDYKVGSILNCQNKPQDWLDFITTIQRTALVNNIPILYGIDSVHGANYVLGATLFPQNIALASTWNPQHALNNGHVTAKDSRTCGLSWVFSPVLDIAGHPQFPRVYETLGEDPYLASVMGRSLVQGYQMGDSPSPLFANLSSPTAALACAKHFLTYMAPKSGMDRTTVWLPEYALYEYYVPSFQAGVDAGVGSVMIDSADMNGVPTHASGRLLTELLRGEMGFGGFAVTDWDDIHRLVYGHHVAATQKDAVRMAVEAGVDMSMVPNSYDFADLLYELVSEGSIPESRIDLSVARILKAKQALGLFEHPLPDPKSPYLATIGSDHDRALARDAAVESVILLRNNDRVLPLAKTARILLTGPTAKSIARQNGGWSIHWQGGAEAEFPFGSTVLSGLTALGATATQYLAGTDVDAEVDIQAVVAAAKAAPLPDAVVVALGEGPYAEGPGDIPDLRLPDVQGQLLCNLTAASAATGVPIVVLLVEGRPRVLPTCIDDPSVHAVLASMLPGSEGGAAIASILLGQFNPSGRLPVSYPLTVNDLSPYYYSYTAAPKFRWPFGFGLSYSTISYSNLTVSPSQVGAGGAVTVSVRVAHTGGAALPAKEVVQVFVSDLYASITPPVRRLRAFNKITLDPGTAQTVSFLLPVSELAIYLPTLHRFVVEPGDFTVAVGPLTVPLTVTAVTA